MDGEGANNSSPFNFIDIIEDYISAALDCGIAEAAFWEMTFAELARVFESKKRQQRQQAINDYVLADLIGRSCARIHSKGANMPTLSEAYPALFDSVKEAETIQKQKDELSALRFKQFAQSYNQKFKEVLR